MKDIGVIFSSNVCTEEEEKKCKEEIGNDEFIEWACSKCEKKKQNQMNVSPTTNHLLMLRYLVKAGYPFSKTDLKFEEWIALGQLNEEFEKRMKGSF